MKIAFLALWASVGFAGSAQLSTVPLLDLSRYMGLWYEVARLPNSCERNCATSTAEYSFQEGGFVGVTSRCIKENGHEKISVGLGRMLNPAQASKRQTNFMPTWLKWSGLGWEDHWIIDLDKNYQWAVVSEPNRKYLWIMSRKPMLDQVTYESIIGKLKEQHFDLSHLIVSNALQASLKIGAKSES